MILFNSIQHAVLINLQGGVHTSFCTTGPRKPIETVSGATIQSKTLSTHSFELFLNWNCEIVFWWHPVLHHKEIIFMWKCNRSRKLTYEWRCKNNLYRCVFLIPVESGEKVHFIREHLPFCLGLHILKTYLMWKDEEAERLLPLESRPCLPWPSF